MRGRLSDAYLAWFLFFVMYSFIKKNSKNKGFSWEKIHRHVGPEPLAFIRKEEWILNKPKRMILKVHRMIIKQYTQKFTLKLEGEKKMIDSIIVLRGQIWPTEPKWDIYKYYVQSSSRGSRYARILLLNIAIESAYYNIVRGMCIERRSK